MVLPHLLARFSGDLHGGPSTWSVGFRFRSASGGDPGGIADIQTKLETWRDAIRALNSGSVFPDMIRQVIGQPTRLQTIRCSAIGTDGKETAVALVEGTPLSIGTSSGVNPSQIAVTASLISGKPGASNRGRVYWPCLGQGVEVTGLITSAAALSIATDTAAFIHDLETAGATLITPGLEGSIISQTKGTAIAIQSVRVGNRLDVQRRRANKEEEAYSVAVIPQ